MQERREILFFGISQALPRCHLHPWVHLTWRSLENPSFFNRKYIFIHGGFFIAMLVFRGGSVFLGRKICWEPSGEERWVWVLLPKFAPKNWKRSVVPSWPKIVQLKKVIIYCGIPNISLFKGGRLMKAATIPEKWYVYKWWFQFCLFLPLHLLWGICFEWVVQPSSRS